MTAKPVTNHKILCFELTFTKSNDKIKKVSFFIKMGDENATGY